MLPAACGHPECSWISLTGFFLQRLVGTKIKAADPERKYFTVWSFVDSDSLFKFLQTPALSRDNEGNSSTWSKSLVSFSLPLRIEAVLLKLQNKCERTFTFSSLYVAQTSLLLNYRSRDVCGCKTVRFALELRIGFHLSTLKLDSADRQHCPQTKGAPRGGGMGRSEY